MQQEYEYIYEHEKGQEQNSARESEQVSVPSGREAERLDNLLGQELATVDELAAGEQASASASLTNEMEEMRDQRATRRLGRVLVMGFSLSLLASLAALWLSSTLISAPDQILPLAFLQMLAANRVLVLSVPAVCLVVCSFALRSLTGEIMVVPERRLDERQKMLRDQAQRSAFKIIKFASVLIPVGFLLPHLPWFSPSPMPVFGELAASYITIDADGDPGSFMKAASFRNFHWRGGFGITFIAPGQTSGAAQLLQSASGPEIALAGGVLLLTLLLLLGKLAQLILPGFLLVGVHSPVRFGELMTRLRKRLEVRASTRLPMRAMKTLAGSIRTFGSVVGYSAKPWLAKRRAMSSR